MMKKLSLRAAIFINLNIMFGVGVFINTIDLAHFAGSASPFIYLIIGIVMAPLVACMARLLQLYAGGSFYTFGKESMNPFVGFLASWSYFTCKLASSSVMVHFAASLIQATLPATQQVPILLLDGAILTLFTALNMLNMRSGSRIQYTFMALKIMPLAFVILTGIWLLTNGQQGTPLAFTSLGSMMQGFPLAIYAFTGFEASCSLSRHIENPGKNGPRAIWISYGIVITILCLYQFLFTTSLGTALLGTSHYSQAFPLLVQAVTSSIALQQPIAVLLQLAIAASALGGAYGILYSNNWNLFVLAEHHLLPGSDAIKRVNRYGIPTLCIMAQLFLCFVYLSVTRGNNIPLQQLGALGSTLAYTISVIGLWVVSRRTRAIGWHAVATLAMFNCVVLLGFCVRGFLLKGFDAFILYMLIVFIGIALYCYKTMRKPSVL